MVPFGGHSSSARQKHCLVLAGELKSASYLDTGIPLYLSLELYSITRERQMLGSNAERASAIQEKNRKHRLLWFVIYSMRVSCYVKEINLRDGFASLEKQWNQYRQMCCTHLHPMHSILFFKRKKKK